MDNVLENNQMNVPKIPPGVSGTALAASILRDGWSVSFFFILFTCFPFIICSSCNYLFGYSLCMLHSLSWPKCIQNIKKLLMLCDMSNWEERSQN